MTTRVLVVDDNAQNLYLLRVLLEAEGFLVDEAQHGGDALQQARRQTPAIVVSDLLMPVMDGYTLLWRWKGDPQLAHIPFLVYTATFVEAKDERLALAMGADAFMVKPSEPEAVLACMRELLARAQRGEPAAAAAPSDQRLLAQYNEVLVKKLERRARQLELSHQKLLESEERFRATFEQAAVGIAHAGPDGRFLRINDRLCEMLGYAREELLQLDFATLTWPEDRAGSEHARRSMIAGTRDHHVAEKRYRRKDGGMVWASLVTTLLRTPAGEPNYFISVLTDISARKALEERVLQSQKLEAVGQLTAGIAHDFNNLLTVIIGNAELLAERLAGDPQLGPLAAMTGTAAERGAALTRQLLAFARRQPLAPSAVDVNATLQGLEHMLARMLPANVVVHREPAPGLWPALVDGTQLESAVLNLAINARDAMPDGGRLTLEAANVTLDDLDAPHADLAPGAYVMVAVSDTGSGIAPEHLARVFDPFFTTKPVGQGSGLGLSMVYGFAKQSCGHVRIYSEPGHGATVRLYLPRAADDVARDAAATQPAELASPDGACILLVEDDDLVRGFARRCLEDLGHRVLLAADGAQALDIVRRHTDVDLLLTDVVMPGGMGGPQLAQAALALRPPLKVLFSSGYAAEALVQGGLLAPGVNLLSKPYSRAALARKVAQVLAGPATGVAPAAARRRLLVLDDDVMVARVLALAAERLGHEAEVETDVAAFLDRVEGWRPSHVAIDLSMPGTDGLAVLDRLVQARCDARVIVASGADAAEIQAALDHAAARGLTVAGALPKPFGVQALRALLEGDASTA